MYSPIAFMSTPAAIRYLAVGDIVEDARPINQGDVYRGITLPGFPAGDHHIVILTTHPCSLRAGARLKPRLQAAPVRRGTSCLRNGRPPTCARCRSQAF